MDDTRDFKAREIVCLEYQATRLYAEMIQVVDSRQVGWIRPLLLAEFFASDLQSESPLLYDLRPSADVLWPLTLIRPVLDTEVMPLLLQLLVSDPPLDGDPDAFTRLYQFIYQAWQADRERAEG